ncbi:hypothetical protein [Maridesulfovibrio sp. FT414]|uniref:hypothetical protein n=1 Tax=Maridesulfovibrio sp. FT414 TaxID=2979469 RepID=UPI003D80552A
MIRKVRFVAAVFVLLLLGACSGAKHMQVELPKAPPEKKVTNYSDALYKLGEMTELFSPGVIINVQSKPVIDKTGTSISSRAGEIPVDITEMLQSAVNRIGGAIRFVPYDPTYIQDSAAYISGGLIPPQVTISGGITEYDRSTEVTGDSADLGTQFGGGGAIGADAGISDKQSVSSITLDMNMIEFATMAMIPQVQSVNTIKVYKGARESDIGFSLFGQSFGIKGTVKKVQGRHAAVRTLVEMCVLELLGKYMSLPYWKCTDGANEDQMVIRDRKKIFKAQDKPNRTWMIQQLMPAYGIEGIEANGVYGARTRAAMDAIAAAYGSKVSPALTADFYIVVFKNAPFFGEPAFDVAALNQKIASLPPEQPEPEVAAVQEQPQQQAQVQQTQDTPAQGFVRGDYDANMNAAKEAFARKDYDSAKDYINRAIENGIVQGDPQPFILMAYIQQARGRIDRVGEILSAGLRYAPESAQLYTIYSRYLISQNQLDQAAQLIDRGLEIAPASVELQSLRSYVNTVRK